MKIMLLYLDRIINSKGGMDKVFCSMSNALVKLGYNVVAVGFEDKIGVPFFPLNENVNFVNAGIGFDKEKTFFYRIRKELFFNKAKKKLYKENKFDDKKAKRILPIIKKENPNLIISFGVEETRILMNRVKTQIPVITMLHFDPDSVLGDITEKSKAAIEHCKCVQVLLPSFIKKAKNYIIHKDIVYIPNVVPQYKLWGGTANILSLMLLG